MTDSLKLAAQKALEAMREMDEIYCAARDDMSRAERDHCRRVLAKARTSMDGLQLALQHQEEREPVLFYAFKHNWGNGKIGWTFHTPEEQATAYRDTCLEIIPLYATPPLQPSLTATAILQAVARGWCHEKTRGLVMDPDLAIAIAAEVSAAISAPQGDQK